MKDILIFSKTTYDNGECSSESYYRDGEPYDQFNNGVYHIEY